MKRLVLFLWAGLALLSAQAQKKDRDLEKLYTYLQGAYHNKTQARTDSDFFEIHLHMTPIWTQQGYWLYVEQATASALDKPYRQRVYKVYRRASDQALVSEIYTLPQPLRFAGAWKNPDLLKGLSPDSLIPRPGCEVVLRADSKGFSGSTGAQTCPSDLRGASYATSEVVLEKKRLVSWDRGYDAQGKQVWGSQKGGYVFEKE